MDDLIKRIAADWVARGYTALDFDTAMLRVLAAIREAEDGKDRNMGA